MALVLRPAFGSGEDWNDRFHRWAVPVGGVAPGLRVGRGLEPEPQHREVAVDGLRPAFGSGEDWNSSGWDRFASLLLVAPGLRVGRGLEHRRQQLLRSERAVAPGLRVGRGSLSGSFTMSGRPARLFVGERASDENVRRTGMVGKDEAEHALCFSTLLSSPSRRFKTSTAPKRTVPPQ